MKTLFKRVGLPAVLTLAISFAGAGGAVAQTAPKDYDADDDGLISVTTLAQLNAMRYDLNGDGAVSQTDSANYAAAFPNAAARMGCPNTGCRGYQLDADLNFDANGDGAVDSKDPYENWTPIGGANSPFTGAFDGKGNAISRLKISRDLPQVGLFARLARSKVENLRLLEVDVISASTAANSSAGALVGALTSDVSDVRVTGRVSGTAVHMGGLAGIGNPAAITSSSSKATVSNTSAGAQPKVGGLVGLIQSASPVSVFASYATGDVSASGETVRAGGLIGLAKAPSVKIYASYARGDVSAGARSVVGGFLGRNAATALDIKASYSTGAPSASSGGQTGGFIASPAAQTADYSYWDAETSGFLDDADASSPEGMTTMDLQNPISATGIYKDWKRIDLTDDGMNNPVNPWDFGTDKQYPAIVFGEISADAQRKTDYDPDDDGLISITNLAQLDAMRHDLDGDGAASQADSANYAAAFPDAESGMGCPSTGCDGYKLANSLTFDTDGDGDVDGEDAYPNWTPIGSAANGFDATFDGGGNAIAKMRISASGADDVGLFAAVSADGIVKGVRLTDADITATGASASVGALAGDNAGTVSASYAGGTVSSTGTGATNVGGLIGENSGTIRASWSDAAVSAKGAGGNVGGLAGKVESGEVTACHARGAASSGADNAKVGGLIGATAGTGNSVSVSYAAGEVTASGTGARAGGLIGSATATTFTASYWDTAKTGIDDDADSSQPEGKGTGKLQSLTVANDIYANWDDLDLTDDAVANAVDDPWAFGTNRQYPALVWGGLRAEDQYADYDSDDDGLIEITNLAHLNAMRHDLDGDGVIKAGPLDLNAYYNAFDNAASEMGCPDAGCEGYELTKSLTFDTDGDGNVDGDDAYLSWTPIGDYRNAFSGKFNGNGNAISKMRIRAATGDAFSTFGLFGNVSGTITGVGLPDADIDVTASAEGGFVGALAGLNAPSGTIAESYATGSVSAAMNSVGGLVGRNSGRMERCWANVNVASSGPRSRTGGLVGINQASITACYSRGDVSATTHHAGGLAGVTGRYAASKIAASYSTGKVAVQSGVAGGLVAYIWNTPSVDASAAVRDSYWDADTSGIAANAGSDRGEGKTTAQLQTPTAAGGIYANWNDPDIAGAAWNFGTVSHYPILIADGLAAEDQYDDYDADDDGLIEIDALSQLAAARHDLNGDGKVDAGANLAAYRAAFTHSGGGMGCPEAGCEGYELAKNLTFDTDANGSVDAADAYPNWLPIGSAARPFAATFDGNGMAISKMTINSAASRVGLFGAISAEGVVKGVGLPDASVTATASARVGALAGDSAGTITSAYASGTVSSTTSAKTHSIGGLVGSNGGMIGASWAGASVSSSGYQESAGGLAGINYGEIIACYATGAVSATGARSVAGGFAGSNLSSGASVKASYSTGAPTASGTASAAAAFIGAGNGAVSDSYWDATTSGVNDDSDPAPPEGRTTSQLQNPISAAGIYSNWRNLDLTGDGAVDNPWDFGTAAQYPVLNWGGVKAGTQRP